jgi:lysozyme family protein
MRYGEKWPTYAKQWDRMKIKPARAAEFRKLGEYAVEHRQRYQTIQDATAHDGLGREGEGVPWYVIAALHRRESDCDWDTYLGNGQSLHKKTTLVPKGRGPWSTFEAGAIDALNVDGLSSVIDWRLEKDLYFSEIFNGAGYHMRGLPSPYIWGGTNIQVAGKFREVKKDGKWVSVFRSTEWDTQPGVAPIISAIAQVANDIEFLRET